MARKMTTKQFRALIKEEASKLHRRTLLENKRKELMKELSSINNQIKIESMNEQVQKILARMQESGKISNLTLLDVNTMSPTVRSIEGSFKGVEFQASFIQRVGRNTPEVMLFDVYKGDKKELIDFFRKELHLHVVY